MSLKAWVYGKPQALGAAFDDHLDPATTAVLSIDMHRGHLDDDPNCPCPAPRARDIIDPINAFHRQARTLGVRVVHVKSVLRADGSDDINGIASAWRRTFPLHVGPIPNAAGHALEGSRWTEWSTEVNASDLTMAAKRRLSAFMHTDLDLLLRNQKITTVVLNGGFADCCVLNTAFDAANLTYRVLVLQDLVRGTDDALETAALNMVSLHLGLVVRSADLLAHWQSYRS
jgi:biuret amidohydrolase